MASLPVVIAGVVFAVAGGSGAGTTGKDSHARSGSPARAARRAGARSASTATADAASFGPHVSNGIFQGTSPEVASLPVLPVTPGPLHSREIESLKPQQSAPGAKDPVVQGKKGTGPISGPIQNFDGICLPFGEPCALPSSCSCLPPDTNGEVGATQYVQMVNTDFVVFSKTGAGAARRDADQPALGERRRRVRDPQRRRPGGALRPARKPLVADAVHRHARRQRGVRRSASPSRRPATRRARTTSTSSTSAARSTTTRSSASGRTRTTCPRTSSRTARRPRAAPAPSPSSAPRCSRASPPGSCTSTRRRTTRRAASTSASSRVTSTAARCRRPARRTCLPRSTTPAPIPPTTPGDDGFRLRLWKFHVDWANPANSTFGNNGAPNYALPVAPYRQAAVRLRLRAELRPAEGRPAAARRPRRPADVPARVPELRQLRVAPAQPHRGDARRP